MLIYWFFWFFLSVFSILSNNKVLSKKIFFLTILIIYIFVGFRFEVGVDRDDYLLLYQHIGGLSLKEALFYNDPGYAFVNYVGNYFNFKDMIFVNSVCAAIFIYTFYKFSKKFQYFWVPLFVSYTYLVVVVSMNYIRQSVSISLLLMGLYFLINNKTYKFLFLLLLATLFHKTAIIFIVFFPVFYFKNWKIGKLIFATYTLVSLIFITYILYLASVNDANIYVSGNDVSSSGAVFRALFHLVPVGLYLYFRKFFENEYKGNIYILDYMVVLVVYCFALAFVFSTLSDRFNLYLSFFDILIYAKVCEILSLKKRNFLNLYLFIFFSFTFFIWLNFGSWADYGWIPYQNYIINFLSNSF
ncbi:EpsG family protein [Acinetobacter guillouiae]|uniref:EpsG family protein n=1 Tax=Acinetobacter TaxID=469 RepID=UPI001FB8BBA6|nr:EpsG family protein [Acinetobacter sp. NyZ410]UOH18519.1 EpsG family protein [Acinetobacter sp. NyZ410]